jgi:hypothetical protein
LKFIISYLRKIKRKRGIHSAVSGMKGYMNKDIQTY